MLELYTAATPSGQKSHIMLEETGPKRRLPFVLIGVIVAVLIGATTDAESKEQILKEQILKITALNPAATQ